MGGEAKPFGSGRQALREATVPEGPLGEGPLAEGPLVEAALASRRRALAKCAVLAVGGALALARPAGAAPPPDVDQLERLLSLEQRLRSLYETALERDAVEPRLGQTLLEHEREHVRGLEQALRARGRRSPRATVPPPQLGAAFANRTAFARFAIDLEAETVRTYQDVLATFRNDRLLLPLGSIMTSGAQHVVALRQAAGEELLAPA
jgi:rubrerythrin